MYKYIFLYTAIAFLVLSLLFLTEVSTLTEYAMAQEEQSSNQTEIVVAQTPEEKANLERFDKLDFEAWNKRNWTLFREIHSPDVLVVDFSGNATRGGDQHVQWAMATMSDALEISAHPIKIAAGNWTAVTGTLPGNVTMATVAHWENGRIAEEYLFMQGPNVID
jgi:hypothetical protein